MFKQQQENSGRKSGALGYIPGLLVVLLVVAGLVMFASDELSPMGSDLGIDEDQYQALFLSNGEVYFGKLDTVDDDYLTLEDIYYLRVTPTLQQSTEVDAAGNSILVENPNEPQINLVKLGNELHGPEDRMVVPLTSVIYWENLSEDGQVSVAIEEAKEAAAEAEDEDEEESADESTEE